MKEESGFTLVEVLSALVIMCLVVSVALQLLAWQAIVTSRAQANIETDQGLRIASMVIEKEIRLAKSTSLASEGNLLVVRTNNQRVKLYVADKDYNGILDLYQETDGVPTPVASCVEKVDYVEAGPGRWDVSMIARQKGVENRCMFTVNQRVKSSAVEPR